MHEPVADPNASRDAFTVPPYAWQCNAHDEAGAEEPTRRNREVWRHPLTLAALITASASLISALTPLIR